MPSKSILGISGFYHDSAAAIVVDGVLVAAAQEERFTRVKGDASFPVNAAMYCLREAGISMKELDCVVFYDKPIKKFDRILASYIHTAPKGIRSFSKAIPIWLRQKLWVEDEIQKQLDFKGKVYFTDHHQSHAASAFFPSPFDDAAILTVDGAGEWATTTLGYGKGNSISISKEIKFPHSIGLLYSAFTYYCGFKVNSGEYKLMGLAPYGKPVFLDLIRSHLVHTAPDGSFSLNLKYFDYVAGLRMTNRNFHKLFGRPPLSPGKPLEQFYMDVAASIQVFLNEHMVTMVRYLRSLFDTKNLVLAGGVALNCVANSCIALHGGFEKVWIQPAAGDSGAAIGAALYAWHSYYGNPRTANGKDTQRGSFLGPKFSNVEVKAHLDQVGAKYMELPDNDLYVKIASELSSQKVVAWFQGRMEFGPRALGNRSILGDARSTEMQSVMNQKIKFRESFRPFAPAILEQYLKEYFDWAERSPYMLFTAPVASGKLLSQVSSGSTNPFDLLKLKRSSIPAVTHVDNSARIQTISAEDSPRFFALLSEFHKQTDCPVLINTSFNVRGEPIVCTPEDAYRCFMGSNIDILVIENCVMFKTQQPQLELSKWKKSLQVD